MGGEAKGGGRKGGARPRVAGNFATSNGVAVAEPQTLQNDRNACKIVFFQSPLLPGILSQEALISFTSICSGVLSKLLREFCYLKGRGRGRASNFAK